MKKRVLSMILAVLMLVSLNITAFAEDANNEHLTFAEENDWHFSEPSEIRWPIEIRFSNATATIYESNGFISAPVIYRNPTTEEGIVEYTITSILEGCIKGRVSISNNKGKLFWECTTLLFGKLVDAYTGKFLLAGDSLYNDDSATFSTTNDKSYRIEAKKSINWDLSSKQIGSSPDCEFNVHAKFTLVVRTPQEYDGLVIEQVKNYNHNLDEAIELANTHKSGNHDSGYWVLDEDLSIEDYSFIKVSDYVFDIADIYTTMSTLNNDVYGIEKTGYYPTIKVFAIVLTNNPSQIVVYNDFPEDIYNSFISSNNPYAYYWNNIVGAYKSTNYAIP